MKLFYGLFAVALTAVVVLFALSNREAVELNLWPLPYSAAAPVFVLALGMFVIGFFCGGLAAWYRGLTTRTKLAAKRAKPLEAEIAQLRENRDGPGRNGAAAQQAIAARPEAL